MTAGHKIFCEENESGLSTLKVTGRSRFGHAMDSQKLLNKIEYGSCC